MRRPKAFELVDIRIHVQEHQRGAKGMKSVDALCNALWVSAKGTKHYYEALELICTITDQEEYHKEFEELKNEEEGS